MKRTSEFGTVTIDIQRLRKGITRIRVVKWKHWGGKIWEASRERFGQLFVFFFFFSKQMKPEEKKLCTGLKI